MGTNFDDMTARIIDKLDVMDDKIDKLCIWKTEMQTEWKNHKEEQDRRINNKDKRFYVIIAVMGVGFATVELIQSIL